MPADQHAIVLARHALLAAAGRRRRPAKRIPRQQFPTRARLEYFTALRKLLAEFRREVNDRLIHQLPSIVRTDSAIDDLEVTVKQLGGPESGPWSDASINTLVRQVAGDVSSQNRVSVGEQLSAGLGFDLFPRDQGVSRELDLFVSDNVRLVKSIRSDLLDELHGIILRGARSSDREQVAKDIAARFGVADSRAELIAVDQVGSLNGELTRLRQTGAGVTGYRWDTSHDVRVRPMHEELQGSVQSWDEPPITSSSGDRNHPGGDYRCRCTAIPVLTDMLQALEQ